MKIHSYANSPSSLLQPKCCFWLILMPLYYFVMHTHIHTTLLSLPCHWPWVPLLCRLCSRHQNGHLSSVSRPPCPLLPPVDTYSPLQLCCSISHPTHAVMGCWLYLSTVMVTLMQMRDFTDWWESGWRQSKNLCWTLSTQLLVWFVFEFRTTSAWHVKASTIMKLELAYTVYITVCSYIQVDRPLATVHKSSNVAAILIRNNKYKFIAIY